MPHPSTGQDWCTVVLSTELTNRPSRVHVSKPKHECPHPCVDWPTSGDFPNTSHSPLPLCWDICSECQPPLPTLPLPQDLLGLSTGQPFFSTTVSAHRFFSTLSVFRDARNWHVSSSLCLCSVVPLGLSLQVTSTWLNPCSYIGRTESRVSMLNLISTLLLRVMGLWASNSTFPGCILFKCRR